MTLFWRAAMGLLLAGGAGLWLEGRGGESPAAAASAGSAAARARGPGLLRVGVEGAAAGPMAVGAVGDAAVVGREGFVAGGARVGDGGGDGAVQGASAVEALAAGREAGPDEGPKEGFAVEDVAEDREAESGTAEEVAEGRGEDGLRRARGWLVPRGVEGEALPVFLQGGAVGGVEGAALEKAAALFGEALAAAPSREVEDPVYEDWWRAARQRGENYLRLALGWDRFNTLSRAALEGAGP
jgi:hypothetical protein